MNDSVGLGHCRVMGVPPWVLAAIAVRAMAIVVAPLAIGMLLG
jgi:hypothetical protein